MWANEKFQLTTGPGNQTYSLMNLRQTLYLTTTDTTNVFKCHLPKVCLNFTLCGKLSKHLQDHECGANDEQEHSMQVPMLSSSCFLS